MSFIVCSFKAIEGRERLGAKDPFPVLPSAQALLLVPGFVSRAARSFLNPQPHDVVHQEEEEEKKNSIQGQVVRKTFTALKINCSMDDLIGREGEDEVE